MVNTTTKLPMKKPTAPTMCHTGPPSTWEPSNCTPRQMTNNASMVARLRHEPMLASSSAAQTKATRDETGSTRVRAATFTTITSSSLVRGSSRSQPWYGAVVSSCIRQCRRE